LDLTPFLVGFVVMSLASVALYARGSKDPEIRHHTYFHSAVPFIAATSYLAMYFAIGTVTPANGVTTPIARYADWSVTTPILLAGLVMLALHERPVGRSAAFLVSIITLDALMIVTGLISSLATDPAARLAFYLWSCAAFAGVLYLLWGPLRSISAGEGGAFNRAYMKNLPFLTLVWFGYPVVFAIGPEGIGSLAPNAENWAILILDVIAKVVYAFAAAANVERAHLEGRNAAGRDDAG